MKTKTTILETTSEGSGKHQKSKQKCSSLKNCEYAVTTLGSAIIFLTQVCHQHEHMLVVLEIASHTSVSFFTNLEIKASHETVLVILNVSLGREGILSHGDGIVCALTAHTLKL